MKSTRNTKKEEVTKTGQKHFADTVADMEKHLGSYTPPFKEAALALWRYRLAGIEPDGELLNKLPQPSQEYLASTVEWCMEFSESSKQDADWWDKIIDALLEKLPEKQRQYDKEQEQQAACDRLFEVMTKYDYEMQTAIYGRLGDILAAKEVVSGIGALAEKDDSKSAEEILREHLKRILPPNFFKDIYAETLSKNT